MKICHISGILLIVGNSPKSSPKIRTQSSPTYMQSIPQSSPTFSGIFSPIQVHNKVHKITKEIELLLITMRNRQKHIISLYHIHLMKYFFPEMSWMCNVQRGPDPGMGKLLFHGNLVTAPVTFRWGIFVQVPHFP